jgi:hypothetical protein
MSLGQCVVAEAECNWHLYDINIYSLSKNICTVGRSSPSESVRFDRERRGVLHCYPEVNKLNNRRDRDKSFEG